MTVAKTGGPIVTLTSGVSDPTGLAVHGGYVYWGTENAQALIERTPAGGGASTVLVPGDNLVGSLAVDAASLIGRWAGTEAPRS